MMNGASLMIGRQMLDQYHLIRKQGCKVKRWKLTSMQALLLAPDMTQYDRLLAGLGIFFEIPIVIRPETPSELRELTK